MATKKPTPTRYRFSVPDEDVSVTEWIKNQNSLSSSVRMLIRDAIRKNGTKDVTCLPVEQYEKRGRPSNAERAKKSEPKVAATEDAPIVPKAPMPAPAPAPASVVPKPAVPTITPTVTTQPEPPKKRDPEKSRLPEVPDDGSDPIDGIMQSLSIKAK